MQQSCIDGAILEAKYQPSFCSVVADLEYVSKLSESCNRARWQEQDDAQTVYAMGGNRVWDRIFADLLKDRENRYVWIDSSVVRAHQQAVLAHKGYDTHPTAEPSCRTLHPRRHPAPILEKSATQLRPLALSATQPD